MRITSISYSRPGGNTTCVSGDACKDKKRQRRQTEQQKNSATERPVNSEAVTKDKHKSGGFIQSTQGFDNTYVCDIIISDFSIILSYFQDYENGLELLLPYHI